MNQSNSITLKQQNNIVKFVFKILNLSILVFFTAQLPLFAFLTNKTFESI